MATLSDLLDVLTRMRVARPAELQAALGVSAATLSRLVASAGELVHRVGRARAVRYVRTRTVEGLGRVVPVFRIMPSGEPATEGTIHLLGAGQHSWERPDGTEELFAGLPPALADMAPQGYLGRTFPIRFPELELPARITDWNDDHRLIAVARRGEDCVGDLVVGAESFARFVAWSPAEATRTSYPALGQRSALDAPGSSAGGEQPKFGAFRGGQHLLVKFATAAATASGRRWRDLLWCEWRALAMVREAGRSASHAAWHDVEGWRFLEVERFDRKGARGRHGVLTLGAIDDEYFGNRDSWTSAAARLGSRPFSLSPEDAATLRWLDAFGQLIGNTDRHFGNVAFFTGARGRLQLAPTYDMLPIILAPVGDTLPERPFVPAPPTASNLDVWLDAARWAVRYWDELAASAELDGSVQAFAAQARTAVAEVARRVSAPPLPVDLP